MAVTYVARVPTYDCTQMTKNMPPAQWPDGVDACNKGDGSPHYHYTDDQIVPLHDSDWLVTWDGGRQIFDDATFQKTFVVWHEPAGA